MPLAPDGLPAEAVAVDRMAVTASAAETSIPFARRVRRLPGGLACVLIVDRVSPVKRPIVLNPSATSLVNMV
ncbi:hypothetical protein GCM10010431_74800 [Streptomyces kunmingensis]